MAHDLLKFGLTLAFMVVVVIAMALLVSGLLSVYKPVEKGSQAPASAVSGGRSVLSAGPSPAPGVNATMRPVPQYAPPGPMMPEPVPAPPVQMEAGTVPPAVWQGPSPSSAPSKPSYEVPAVPSAPGINGILQVLFRMLPLIFSHRFDLTPIWPQLK